MFTVHSGSGAQDYSIGDPCYSESQWSAFRRGAAQLLRARGFDSAAELLATLPFEIRQGDNFFGDDFVVLHAEVSIDRYAELVEEYTDRENRSVFRQMAAALQEICPGYIRFISFSARVDDGIDPIQAPQLAITSRTVEEALADARHLVATRGSVSGVDRAHTAFHGYLRALCEQAGIDIADDANVPTLFRALRHDHPSLQADGPRSEDITHLLRALSSIVSRLNPLRNRATLAHPNQELLEQGEADLVLNCIHTLLHYLNCKLQ